MAIMRPTLMYGRDACTTTVTMARKLNTFKNKVRRKICGPVFDTGARNYRRKHNRKI